MRKKTTELCKATTVINIRAIEGTNEIMYLSTRAVADFLKLKQPFEFTSRVSKLTGEIPVTGTQLAYGGKKNARATYLSVESIYNTLIQINKLGLRYDEKRRATLLRSLSAFLVRRKD